MGSLAIPPHLAHGEEAGPRKTPILIRLRKGEAEHGTLSSGTTSLGVDPVQVVTFPKPAGRLPLHSDITGCLGMFYCESSQGSDNHEWRHLIPILWDLKDEGTSYFAWASRHKALFKTTGLEGDT